MLGISLPSAQKFADIDIGSFAARWDIGFVPDKRVPGSGITPEKPFVAVRATVEFSLLTDSGLHGCSSSSLNPHSLDNRFGSFDPHPPARRPIAHNSALNLVKGSPGPVVGTPPVETASTSTVVRKHQTQ